MPVPKPKSKTRIIAAIRTPKPKKNPASTCCVVRKDLLKQTFSQCFSGDGYNTYNGGLSYLESIDWSDIRSIVTKVNFAIEELRLARNNYLKNIKPLLEEKK